MTHVLIRPTPHTLLPVHERGDVGAVAGGSVQADEATVACRSRHVGVGFCDHDAEVRPPHVELEPSTLVQKRRFGAEIAVSAVSVRNRQRSASSWSIRIVSCWLFKNAGRAGSNKGFAGHGVTERTGSER
jgi:hypothetical protein